MGAGLYDICIIGGGINGAAIARDAAGRGLSVLLVEKDDLASATSSASTKLIHGGLRYLEYYDFRVVREALSERANLLRAAPHAIRPRTFILPHEKHLRPAWMIRAGLFLYDHLGERGGLAKSRAVDLRGGPLKENFTKGFSYSDCCTDDARLVVLNAVDARAKGAHILTRTACTSLRPQTDHWEIGLRSGIGAGDLTVRARTAVNAAGPWVRGLLERDGLDKDAPHVRLVKGSHIVVPKLYDGDYAYILQQEDRRIVFAIPYEEKFTLVGTTEVAFKGDANAADIDADEVDYLCAAVTRAFRKPLLPRDIVWSYSGVRTLIEHEGENSSALTREYILHLDKSRGPDLLSVFGGKLTTGRRLAEEAVGKLTTFPAWTKGAALPGGDMEDFAAFVAQQKNRYPDLPAERLARAYGTRMDKMLECGPGRHLGDGVHEAEISYLVQEEFAMSAEDVLWRRSKLGLHVGDATRTAIEDFFQ